MKKLKYTALGHTENYNFETGQVERKETFVTVTRPYSEAGEKIAKREACNGEYTIEDDGVEEVSAPSQLDMIEAQVAYTAMMTDTLLEV